MWAKIIFSVTKYLGHLVLFLELFESEFRAIHISSYICFFFSENNIRMNKKVKTFHVPTNQKTMYCKLDLT